MPRILIAMLMLLYPCLSFAGTAQVRSMMGMWGAAASGGGGGYDFTETFDATGYDNTWTESLGNPNEDYTTSPAPLEGVQSLYLGARESSDDQEIYTDIAQVTAGARMNVRFRINCPNLPSATGTRTLARITTTTSGRASFYIIYTTGPKLAAKVFSSGETINTAQNMAENTDYYVHVRYKKGSGSDAVASIGFGTTWPVPTSGTDYYAESTGGNVTADGNRLYIGGDNYNTSTSSYNCVIDRVEKWED